jgi:hypothetical protein
MLKVRCLILVSVTCLSLILFSYVVITLRLRGFFEHARLRRKVLDSLLLMSRSINFKEVYRLRSEYSTLSKDVLHAHAHGPCKNHYTIPL